MTIAYRNWTIFGFVRWTLAVAVLAVISFVLLVFLDENVRSFYEYYGLDKILSRVSDTLPDILFHRETWFGAGVLIGAAAMVWLVWAFPHRLGESNANDTPFKKRGIVVAMVAILAGLIAYLHFGRQPVLTLSNEDTARILMPVQKELQDTKDALEKEKKETETARQASIVPINVASAPTHVRLQFNSVNADPTEIDAANVHWTTISYTYRVSRNCPYPQLPTYCAFGDPKGDKNDFDQLFIHLILSFDRPVIYKSLSVDPFGAKVGYSIAKQSDRLTDIELTPDKTVTSFVLNVKAVP